ncbi:MAG TPA: hypothetical protein HA263_11405 [Methanoregulaceae archaeon]|nr:hypothetical protein [Methanoregulaceae archaeon]
MVTAAGLLEVPGLRFVEPSFAELTDELYSSVAPDLEATDGRLLVDEDDDPIAIALRDDDAWHVATFLYRTPSVIWLERFEETGGEIYQEPRETWARAVRAHYADRIRAEVPPAINDLPPDRFAKARDLVAEHWGAREGVRAIDACCGSGIGAAVLRSLGMAPLSYDNDAELIALGLAEGRLLPEEVCCIDGTFADDYVEPAPLGLALMVGQCYPGLNEELWRSLVLQLLALSDETLITLGTEPEAALVAGWVVEAGRGVEVFENERDPIYDRWVCLASR